MYRNFKIVKIDSNYCNFLRKFDSRVPFNEGKKELRPYVGVLFEVDDIEYFAPLSSPKPKHVKLKNTLDLVKIDNGNYGVININNMIPVNNNYYDEFDLNEKVDDLLEFKRLELLKDQLRWLNSNKNDVYKKSRLLYHLYKKGVLPENIVNRCCDFPLLEEKSKLYKK